MWAELLDFVSDYTVRTTLIGTALLGGAAAIIGVFMLLRQQSLLADAISHAALPGMAIVFLCGGGAYPSSLYLGGCIAGAGGTLLVWVLSHVTTLKKDAILGIVLSVFFGIGLVLITYIQKKSIAQQALLKKFLFGNTTTLLIHDVYVALLLSITVLMSIIIWRRTFTLLAFDYAYAKTQGYQMHVFDAILTGLMIITIVTGLQMVGVVLMSSLLIAPAAAARQWCKHVRGMMVLAAVFGVTSAALGTVLSSLYAHVPTGPIIVVILSIIVFVSLLCAPERGMLWRYLRRMSA